MHLKSLSEPGFVRETLKNVTVPEGRDVLLSCTVKNLDGHKVSLYIYVMYAWFSYNSMYMLVLCLPHIYISNYKLLILDFCFIWTPDRC